MFAKAHLIILQQYISSLYMRYMIYLSVCGYMQKYSASYILSELFTLTVVGFALLFKWYLGYGQDCADL